MTEINSGEGEPSSVVDVKLLEKMLEKRQERSSKIDRSLPDKPADGKNPCIFRLPPRLKSENIKGLPHSQYSPKVVSIGPYWRDNDGLKKEELKWHCLEYSLVDDTIKERYRMFSESFGSLERKARDCYSENIDRIESNDFLEMMVLDGCFIIQFLKFFGSRNIREERDHPFGRMVRDRDRVMFQKICMDLLMLENQIPYFVLEKLFEFFGGPSCEVAVSLPLFAVTTFSQILEIGSFYFEDEDDYNYYFRGKTEGISGPDGAKFLHLLDLVWSIFTPLEQPSRSRSRYRKERFSQENRNRLHLPERVPSFFIPPCSHRKERFRQENGYRPLRTVPRISKLRRAGIKVKPRKKDRFLVVEFVQSRVIEMPNISLNELMCSFLVNCVAFEQSCNTRSKHFSVYALFLDYLVNTAEDVE
jgi:hypothetical protein